MNIVDICAVYFDASGFWDVLEAGEKRAGFEFILVQSHGAAGLDDMLELLLFYDPFLRDEIAGFKHFFFQEYNI